MNSIFKFTALCSVVVAVCLLVCCNDDTVSPIKDAGTFSLEARYDSLRAVPGGDALLPIRIVPANDFSGGVNLSVSCDTLVSAGCTKRSVTRDDPVAEIRIRPDSSCDTLEYQLQITAFNDDTTVVANLPLRVVQWHSVTPPLAADKRDSMLAWVTSEYPDLEQWDTLTWEAFQTYPQILVVNHTTFLSAMWEVRECHHVTIPPHDWSMLCIRHRWNWEPTLAVKRESDGTTYEIPVGDYPDMWD
ncbi:hypothetical protein GF377_08485 [candidate division GN15 bacterium]|nr:hypothetical protein [candidate division GN15 bacterium]